jgi:cytochrome c-type biogenesis protein CcmH/NrfF
MRRYHQIGWLFILIIVSAALIASVVADEGPATQSERAYEIKSTMLCPVCDGQNVLESNAPVAAAIRAQVDDLVAEGRSNSEIRAWMARQYGSDVNANPPRSGLGAIVWVLPVLVGVMAVGLLVLAFARWRSGREIEPSEEDIRIVQALREQN